MRKRYGRSQKYHARPRHLYALLFNNGCAYIGQSVNPGEREKQHRRPTGGWGGKSFRFVPLGTVHATENHASHYEHAWRHKAAKNAWRIYAKPPGLVVNHHRQMSLRRYMLAWTLHWPAKHSRNRIWRTTKALVVVSALVFIGSQVL